MSSSKVPYAHQGDVACAHAVLQVVLGSDVLYEPYQAAALAATLQQRIAPGGMALLCCPVREQVKHCISLVTCSALTPAAQQRHGSSIFLNPSCTVQEFLHLPFRSFMTSSSSGLSVDLATSIKHLNLNLFASQR